MWLTFTCRRFPLPAWSTGSASSFRWPVKRPERERPRMSFVFPPRAPFSAPILGRDDGFPIGRIYCVGRNYAAHAREMGGDLSEPPCFFAKDADAYAPSGAT